ncbi:thiol:disulfide interchange protein DsbA/DsbL [Vibrio panuliri]|uniref:Thiol-disulfide isomerase n=1 Tax=Vibrio panuliri TaxID=1381081 RepID=A0A1Q9HAA0_9VIBR|nr:thiol:disulfide interchange protein DsbA/DsbL [Vibrio panuliri]KAB1457458.1 thiol:disulfide interchange protein DsbA/DsbL [Vibrio panuliri]OLQ85905.1 thiol-disulfide isomerase [Vibrio panuliri]OLQ91380.1 thiol-disulfide isomerase [Vibrio panuliri]
MKKMIAILLLGMSTLLVGCSENSTPVEGKQYKALPTNLSVYRLPQVTEVFSLNCGHCKQMESQLPKLEKLINQSVGKVHVTFNEGAQIGAMIYYSAEMQLGKKPDHQMMLDLFSAVQMGDGATMAQKKGQIDNAFQSRGLVSPYDINEEQQNQLFQAMQIADDITTKGEINGVPTFIVNGKYEIITSGHESIEQIADTINYLIKQ